MAGLHSQQSYLSSSRLTNIGGRSKIVVCLVVFGGNKSLDSHIPITIDLVIDSNPVPGHNSRIISFDDR